MRTTDRRFIKTEKIIVASMIKLLGKNDYGRVSVFDLCEEADINKSTFYLHYQSLDQLVGAIEDEVVSGLSEVFYGCGYGAIPETLIPAITSFLKSHKKQALAAFRGGRIKLYQKVINLALPFINGSQPSKKKKTKPDLNSVRNTFLLNGVIGVYSEIVLSGMLSKEDDVNNHILSIINGFKVQ